MHRFLALILALPIAAATPATEGVNRFAADLYRQLAAQKGNLVFSPLSISTALAMTLPGARGQTAQQIQSVLHTAPDAALLEQLTHAGNASGDQLLLSQSLWVERTFPLLPEFVAANRQQFHADPRAVDFHSASNDARGQINRWVSDQTKGKIPTLFAPGTITPATRLVLASAVYFNGKWATKFDSRDTAPAPFHVGSGAPIETPFMNHTGRFPYAETDSAQILELPYAGGSLAFDVILPKAGATLATLEEAFAGNGLSAWVGQLHPRQVQVALPKFRAEAQFALKPALSALGMGLAFSDSADFSGMAGRRDLTISEVVHKAFLDVSEEGTVAAAATGAVMSLTAYAPPTAFRADHPFLFLIRDTVAGTVLFAGRLTAPQR